MTAQRGLFAADGQEPLFDTDELDLLDDIAEQASDEDRDAAAELARWSRS